MNLFENLSNHTLVIDDCLNVFERLDDKTIDLIYLDPPWNTGQNYILNEKTNVDYEDFLYGVLQHSKRVLKDEGNIILYSVPELNIDFHNLLSAVFGKENFRAEFIIPKIKLNNNSIDFYHNHETIINYKVTEKSKFFPRVRRPIEEINQLFPKEENGKRYRLQSLISHGKNNGQSYTWSGFSIPENSCWKYSENRMDSLEKEGKIYFEIGMKYPKMKVFSDDFSMQTISSIWSDVSHVVSKGRISMQKPEKILDRVIQLFSIEGDIVLDPFAGSGTSGASAISKGRKWLGVERVEEIKNIILKRLENYELQVITKEMLLSFQIEFFDYFSFRDSEEEIYLKKISKGENERMEFKENYLFDYRRNEKVPEMPIKIIKEITAFLNSKYGGELIIGVTDEGEVIGINHEFELVESKINNLDSFELSITNKLKDKLGGVVIDLVNISFIKIQDKIIASLKVTPSKNLVFLGNEFIIRNGTAAISLKAKQFHDFISQRSYKK